jgi:hypothetical protein
MDDFTDVDGGAPDAGRRIIVYQTTSLTEGGEFEGAPDAGRRIIVYQTTSASEPSGESYSFDASGWLV